MPKSHKTQLGLIGGIRNLYTPLQPTIKHANSSVIYCEHLPNLELQPFIYCYWELKTTTELKQPFTYRVVTDGCIDVFFEVKRPEKNFVMGFCKQYTEFALDNTFHYVGIRFLPTIFPQIFKVDASLLSNKFQLLSTISQSTSEFISNQFSKDASLNNIPAVFDEYFLDIINEKNFDDDSRLYDAINIILKNFGVVNLKADIDTGVSPRQLRRLFNYYIGDTPKSFSKVVRFQNILKAKPSSQSLKQNKLFYDLGYYDQAHFIKDFKNFYGVTPSKAFGR